MAGLFDRVQPEPTAGGEAKPLDVTTEGSVSLTLRDNWEDICHHPDGSHGAVACVVLA